MSFVGRSRVGSGANGRARFRARARVRVAGMAQLARAAAIVALVFACALVFASPAAFGKVGRGYTLVRLSEVVRSIFYAPQYVALARGFFEDEGLRIDLSTAWGADKGAAALISGACDIGFFGPEAAIYINNPLHPYTKALLSAIPVPDPKRKHSRIILSGDLPSPANPPSGCKFRTRCPMACELCAKKEPEYRNVGNDHFVACHFVKPNV
ncbi:MAG TPA: hypothetical protein DDZ84_07760 [Firmicutes bacterium]|nr:hypothetical protein [Bacillota bacterium]